MKLTSRDLLTSLAATVAIATPEAVIACQGPHNTKPYLHQGLPEVPEGMLAARVEITDKTWRGLVVLEARVLGVLRGEYRADRLRIAPEVVTSCDGIPGPGAVGILVGKVRGVERGVLVVDPLRAPSPRELDERALRLPDTKQDLLPPLKR